MSESGPVEWISKSEAARLLDKSERTILSMASSGKLRSKQERDAAKGGQKVTLLHAGDVARWVAACDISGTFGDVALTGPSGGPMDLAKFDRDFETEISSVHDGLGTWKGPQLERLQKAIDAEHDNFSQLRELYEETKRAPRPWLTLGEAAEYSGLPKSTLQALIDASQLKAIDCGPRPGGRYRIKRVDLDGLEGMNL